MSYLLTHVFLGMFLQQGKADRKISSSLLSEILCTVLGVWLSVGGSLPDLCLCKLCNNMLEEWELPHLLHLVC